jgi:hypothetical protein
MIAQDFGWSKQLNRERQTISVNWFLVVRDAERKITPSH